MYFGLPMSINQATTIGTGGKNLLLETLGFFKCWPVFISFENVWCWLVLVWCSSLKYPATDVHQALFSISGVYIIYN